MSATYTAEEFAAQLGVSPWAVYQAVRNGESPVAPIRVGRRIVFAKAAVDALLGLENSEDRGTHPRSDATTTAAAVASDRSIGGVGDSS